MKFLQRWDYDLHDYIPFVVPNECVFKIYSDNMDDIINCCQCFKEMKFGEGYTSMEVHTGAGFGYAVCEKCHDEEWERRRKYCDE